MNPQPVQIHGTPCLLKTGGGALTPYVVTRCDSGAVITQQPTRFLAVARAALVLMEPAHAQSRPLAVPGVPHSQDRPAFAGAAHAEVHAASLPLHGLHLPAPADGRRVLPEPGCADAARAAGGRARGRPAGPDRRRDARHARQADEGLAV